MAAGIVLVLAGVTAYAVGGADSGAEGDGVAMVRVGGGSYVPLYGDGEPVSVAAFLLDVRLVTNADYRAFVRDQPRWQRSKVTPLLAGPGYLRHWQGDLVVGEGESAPLPDAPVTHVSWFAARAYCGWRDARLPTLDEWELVALADAERLDGTDDPSFHQRILDWYGRPRTGRLAAVGSTFRNAYGVDDMHGLVWEWVEDWNSVFVTGESRADGSLDRQLYCAGAGAGAGDARNYAAFLRYAMRSSLEARYAVGNLGFRCAKDER